MAASWGFVPASERAGGLSDKVESYQCRESVCRGEFGSGYLEQQQRRCEVVQHVEVFWDSGTVHWKPVSWEEQLQNDEDLNINLESSGNKTSKLIFSVIILL